MNVVGILISGLGAVALIGLCVGLVNYLRIFFEARAAGRDFWDLYWFGTYRYAFEEKKGSPETRWMVIGFGTTLGAALVLMLVGLVAGGSRH